MSNGAVDDLSFGSRSFEEVPTTTTEAARNRANTAPPEVLQNLSTDDEEVRAATAAAMAVSNNPNLSVDQAQKVGKQRLLSKSRLVQSFRKSEESVENFSKQIKKELKKSFRMERVRKTLKVGSGDGDGHLFRTRIPTPRSPPMDRDLGENSPDVAEDDDGMKEKSNPPSVLSPSVAAPTSTSMEPGTPTNNVIRLTALAWKRRGGMGKYSTTGAWERRRIELRGHRLLYYKKMSDDADEEEDNSTGAALNVAPTISEDNNEGVVVARRSTWFEQAFTSATTGSEADVTMPRGELNLVKEKAIVAATLGHTGAPSPFAISIKCWGETKWKLCFDHHKDQMEWLAALTDVTVGASVDSYNARLLEAVDPSHINDSAIFPTSVSSPPETHHRLWQMEYYTISNERSVTDASLEDAIGPSDIMEELEAEEMKAAELDASQEGSTAVSESSSSMFTGASIVPQQNFWMVGAVVNLALGAARASSTSLEGFWYIVALTNLGLYLCTVEETKTEILRTVPVATLNGGRTNARSAKSFRRPSTARTAKAVAKEEPKPGFKPIAGTTSVKLQNPTDPPANAKGELFAGWRCPSAEILNVRGLGYSTQKKKQPSPGELYDCVQVEVFESPHRYPDMAPRVELPKLDFKDDGPKTWRTPDIFVISIALPTDPPKFGRSSSDGGGYTVTLYLAMRPETREILKRVTADGYDPSQENPDNPSKSKVNAVRLLEEWCRRAPSDPSWFSRFKVVPNAHNLKEIGMPGWISSYNGKPFLIKRPGVTGFIHQHPELSCLEFDISLHPFPYLAKQGICFMKDSYFKKVLVTFGFVIEGKTDDELPECILGCMQLCYPDPIHAIQASDFFAGTAPRSF